ncbi:MAG: hypothetical protein RIT02_810 [Planctomycetota bacterium]
MVSGQWSVVSGQWSVVGGRWSVVGGWWGMDLRTSLCGVIGVGRGCCGFENSEFFA